MRNLLSRVPKSAHGLVAPLVRSIFEQADADSAWAQHARVVEHLTGRFDAAADLLADAADEILAFSAFPKAHWR
jgi:putative transposase